MVSDEGSSGDIAVKTADRRQLYIRALVVVRLHELRERLGTQAEQVQLDKAALDHAEKMLRNTMRRLGLRLVQGVCPVDRAREITTVLDQKGQIPERLMEVRQ